MNRKESPKQAPSYSLEGVYDLVIAHWQAEVSKGRVTIRKSDALQELVRAGAVALGVTPSPTPAQKKTRTKAQSLAPSSAS